VLRRFIRDSAIYAGAGIFSQGIAFLLFPFLAHRLHPSQYGVIDIVGLLTTLALLSVALEINQGLGRLVAGVRDHEERSEFASTALIWSVASYTVLAVVGLIAAEPLTHLLLGPHVNVWIMRVALIGVWVAGALYLIQDQLRWQGRPRVFAIVTGTAAIVTTGTTAIYVFVLNGGAVGVIAGQLSGATAALLVALACSPGIYQLRFKWEKARVMLAFSIPLVPSSLGVFLNIYADRLAIQHEESLAAVGVYGIGFRLAIVVSLLLLGVQGATTPLVLAHHSEPETPRELAQVFRLFWAVGCITFLVLSIFAEPLVRILSAPSYFAGASVVPFLVAAIFLAGLYVFAPGPTIAGRTRMFAAVNVAAGLLNLALAFGLVPLLGIRGAGVATLAASTLMFASMMWLSQRLYPVPHDWVRLTMGAAAAIAFVVVTRSLLAPAWGEALNITPLFVRLLSCGLGTLVVLILLVSRAELRQVLALPRHTSVE
jgi:O-antigen/teichoic acid export membrane protein